MKPSARAPTPTARRASTPASTARPPASQRARVPTGPFESPRRRLRLRRRRVPLVPDRLLPVLRQLLHGRQGPLPDERGPRPRRRLRAEGPDAARRVPQLQRRRRGRLGCGLDQGQPLAVPGHGGPRQPGVRPLRPQQRRPERRVADVDGLPGGEHGRDRVAALGGRGAGLARGQRPGRVLRHLREPRGRLLLPPLQARRRRPRGRDGGVLPTDAPRLRERQHDGALPRRVAARLCHPRGDGVRGHLAGQVAVAQGARAHARPGVPRRISRTVDPE